MTTGVDELVARVAAVRSLPAAPDRRRIRVEAGVSLRDVADAVGVSHSAIVAWERGMTPSEQHLPAYADLLSRLVRLTTS